MGGMLVETTFKNSLSASVLRKELSARGIVKPIIQEIGSSHRDFLIWYRYTKGLDMEQIPNKIADVGGLISRAELVSPNMRRKK